MRSLAIPLLVACLLSPAASARGEELGLDAEQKEKLAAGEVLVERREPTGGTGVAVRGFAVVSSPPGQVWPVLRDCGEQSQFMPRVKESQRLEIDGATVCRTVTDVPFPFSDILLEVRSEEQELAGGGFRRSWSLLRGDFERNQGSWTLLPWGEKGHATLLLYDSDVEPKTILPDFILGLAQGEALPDAMEAVRRRVKELERDVSSPP